MTGPLRIGGFAQLLGVTTKTIRHYHRIGLLPEPPRAPNGYRRYGFEAVLRALRILRLRQLGLSLREIEAVLAEQPATPEPDSILHRLVADLDEQIDRLQAQRAKVVDLIETQERWDPHQLGDSPSPTMRVILERFGDVLGDASPALLAREQHTWAVLDALPGMDTAAWAASLLGELEADRSQLELMGAMLPELARIADWAVDDPGLEAAAVAFAAGHDLSALAAGTGGAEPNVPEAYASIVRDVIQDSFSPAQLRFIQRVSALGKARDQR